jgi:hypothetical protein
MGSRDRLNNDQPARDAILGISGSDDYAHFNDLSYTNLLLLISEGFAEMGERQNDAPSIGDFIEAFEGDELVRFHGYAIGLERDDYRVSIEGFDRTCENVETLLGLVLEYRWADELSADSDDMTIHTWWD